MAKCKQTARGFNYVEFTDEHGAKCSIQNSSCVVPQMWIGSDTASPHYEDKATYRMLLGKKQVKMLLPLLKKFLKDGEI